MSVTVKNSLSLRQNYSNDTTLMLKANRAKASVGKLSQADSLAMRRSVKKLASYDYEDSDADKLEETLRAFTDTYNYLKESSTVASKTNPKVKAALNKMKKLTEEYSDELEKYGVTKDSKGYLAMSDSATDNIKGTKFESLFGKDSEFMQEIAKYSKSIYRHIDIQL